MKQILPQGEIEKLQMKANKERDEMQKKYGLNRDKEKTLPSIPKQCDACAHFVRCIHAGIQQGDEFCKFKLCSIDEIYTRMKILEELAQRKVDNVLTQLSMVESSIKIFLNDKNPSIEEFKKGLQKLHDMILDYLGGKLPRDEGEEKKEIGDT